MACIMKLAGNGLRHPALVMGEHVGVKPEFAERGRVHEIHDPTCDGLGDRHFRSRQLEPSPPQKTAIERTAPKPLQHFCDRVGFRLAEVENRWLVFEIESAGPLSGGDVRWRKGRVWRGLRIPRETAPGSCAGQA